MMSIGFITFNSSLVPFYVAQVHVNLSSRVLEGIKLTTSGWTDWPTEPRLHARSRKWEWGWIIVCSIMGGVLGVRRSVRNDSIVWEEHNIQRGRKGIALELCLWWAHQVDPKGLVKNPAGSVVTSTTRLQVTLIVIKNRNYQLSGSQSSSHASTAVPTHVCRQSCDTGMPSAQLGDYVLSPASARRYEANHRGIEGEHWAQCARVPLGDRKRNNVRHVPSKRSDW